MIYIFEEIDRLTSSYFSGGGLVISAKDIDQAKQLIEAQGAGLPMLKLVVKENST